MTDAALLDHITRLPHAKANFKQLVRELGAKGATRADLELSLARLLARGDLVEPRPGHYVVTARSREYAVGRINMHRDGYGFLIPDRPIEGIQGDIYIPRRFRAQGHAWRPRAGAHRPHRGRAAAPMARSSKS